MSKAVLLMAHGAPADLEEVEEYVLHIRDGRPLSPEQMEAIKDRYRQVGGSPLLRISSSQAEAVKAKLKEMDSGVEQVYLGMRHSHPFIAETLQQMAADQVTSFVAVCLAPQSSMMTTGAYRKALEDAATGRSMEYSMVQSYARHPKLIAAFTAKLQQALAENPSAFVVFTAHSLPSRILGQADSYDWEVKETARLVAVSTNLKDWRFAYQSQGMTSDPWLGPSVETVIDALLAKNISEVLIAPIGFVCDHMEILYDIDIQFRDYARSRGIILHRTESLNDCEPFVDLLCTLIRERL
jgi:ferrochelatase